MTGENDRSIFSRGADEQDNGDSEKTGNDEKLDRMYADPNYVHHDNASANRSSVIVIKRTKSHV